MVAIISYKALGLGLRDSLAATPRKTPPRHLALINGGRGDLDMGVALPVGKQKWLLLYCR